jgi:DNA-binding transcriptional LysR family regulator
VDIDSLKIAADIARAGNFAAVAREHGVEPSSISRAISVLEASLGFRLFQRSTRKVALSEAGALYHNRIETALAELDAAREEARALSEGPTGVLRLTASPSLGMKMIAPLLPELRAHCRGSASRSN